MIAKAQREEESAELQYQRVRAASNGSAGCQFQSESSSSSPPILLADQSEKCFALEHDEEAAAAGRWTLVMKVCRLICKLVNSIVSVYMG